MIYVILAIALIIFLLIVSILMVPFGISLQLTKKASQTQGTLRINWLGITFIRRKIPKEEKIKEKERTRFDWRDVPEIVTLFIESYSYFINIINAIIKSVSIRKLSCNVVLGLDSPVDTAILSGHLWSITSLINILPNVYLIVKPDFKEKRLDGYILVELKIRLLKITTAFVRAFFKKPVRQMFRIIRR